jgi:Domain of unknown function (DUF1824)
MRWRPSLPSLLLLILLVLLLLLNLLVAVDAFLATTTSTNGKFSSTPLFQTVTSLHSIEEATQILSEWDKWYINNDNNNNNNIPGMNKDESNTATTCTTHPSINRSQVSSAVRLLSEQATTERNLDSTKGRCMLGICASSAEQGVATLKSWVSALQLPRGLLHGMDKDGIPLNLDGGVYIKYNSGGVYTFEDIRKSGMGFDALWKPGDALLETYDGNYRGVYFQVELADEVFRQYLVPLDLFDAL